jgi:hypothetical protein
MQLVQALVLGLQSGHASILLGRTTWLLSAAQQRPGCNNKQHRLTPFGCHLAASMVWPR